ncbi:MAG: hypothetical protein EX268_06650 [Deltaproteobacteria bacterium]|nr:MAG: hypothetical protein EX268_06650 [Deltaproteobacteria bacterium]
MRPPPAPASPPVPLEPPVPAMPPAPAVPVLLVDSPHAAKKQAQTKKNLNPTMLSWLLTIRDSSGGPAAPRVAGADCRLAKGRLTRIRRRLSLPWWITKGS